jgi:long-chain acyl-CoA synthetase
MLLESLLAHARTIPQTIAVVDPSGSHTYQQLSAMVRGLGAYLAGRTTRARVGLLLPPGVTFAVGFYGTLFAGKTAVPINYLLGDRQFTHIVKDSDVDTVLTAPPLDAELNRSALNVVDLTSLPRHMATIPATPPQHSADDVAAILYTSGTTGLPKGVELTYGNFQSSVEAVVQHAHIQGTHRFLGILPLFHSTGLLATLVAPIRLGSTVYYQPRFSPAAAVKAIKDQQISVIVAVPSMYGAMLRVKNAGPGEVQSLYAAISGGEALPARIREGWLQRFGTPIFEGYGLTETVGPVAFNTPDENRPGSVGRLIPGTSARIIDERGIALPQGATGEVCLKGPVVMNGYLNLPDATAEAMTSDGFFRTGDVGRFDDGGYLYITGRAKEMISIAGEKVAPREIEEILMENPGVSEAAVIARQDATRGEAIVAYILPAEGQSPSPEQLRAFCRSRGLAQWKVPRDIRIVAALPRSPGGKVLKRELAAQADAGAFE